MITSLRKYFFFLARYEEGGRILFRKIPGVSTSESGAPTSHGITESITHSRMEMGGGFHGFYKQVTKDKVST